MRRASPSFMLHSGSVLPRGKEGLVERQFARSRSPLARGASRGDLISAIRDRQFGRVRVSADGLVAGKAPAASRGSSPRERDDAPATPPPDANRSPRPIAASAHQDPFCVRFPETSRAASPRCRPSTRNCSASCPFVGDGLFVTSQIGPARTVAAVPREGARSLSPSRDRLERAASP